MPKFKELNSTAISGYEYSQKDKLLTMYFTDGTHTKYGSVPVRVPRALAKAESAGNYFNNNIRNSYEVI